MASRFHISPALRNGLLNLAPELLQHIAYYSAEPLGPPSALLAFQLSCKAVYNAIAFDVAPYLYARIFCMKFDIGAPVRHLGRNRFTFPVLANELRRRCVLLKRIRSLGYWQETIREDLWLAYLMMIENDGRNERQLLDWANLKCYVQGYLRERLAEGSERNSGWPLETEENALAVWLLWLTSDEVSIKNESAEDYKFFLSVLQPFIVAPFKMLFIPDTHFLLPITRDVPPTCYSTLHGLYPVYRSTIPANEHCLTHFGQRLTLCAPPLTPAAILSMCIRRQAKVIQAPIHLRATRAEVPPGDLGPTIEDFTEVINVANTKYVSRVNDMSMHGFEDDWLDKMDVDEPFHVNSNTGHSTERTRSPSSRHDHDWLRITHCYNPWLDAKLKIRIFTPGMLDGLWAGRAYMYNATQYAEVAGQDTMPTTLSSTFPAAFQMPLFMRLREHHCLPGQITIGWGENAYSREAEGLSNAFFPPETEFNEHGNELHLFDHTTEETLIYETYNPGRPNSHVLSGGCEKCQAPGLSLEQRREAQRIFDDNGFGLGESNSPDWDDEVEDNCITDIVITGMTDYDHGRAWGFYKLVGRVRDADGLVILLRTPVAPTAIGAGTWIFRGYIHSNQNFVGRWRPAVDPPDAFSSVEGSFSLCKVNTG